ncbi:MAG: hypothetical protein AAGB34_04350, partial [Planctomycetota bacterium]
MLTKLTPEQEARIPEWIEKWTAVGLSTEPIDIEQARSAIAQEYAVAGIRMPSTVTLAPDPLTLAISGPMSSAFIKDGVNVWANVRDNVRDNVWANVWANVRDNVWANVGDNVRDNVGENLGDNDGDNGWAKVRDNGRAKVGATGGD